MLRKILAITGRPGLYNLISQGKNMLIVESLSDGKRQPAYSHDKVVSLHDIAIYADSGEVPLYEVFAKMEEKTGGRAMEKEELNSFFAEVLPDYDRERVHQSDIKKVFSWYNILIEKGYKDFKNATEETAPAE